MENFNHSPNYELILSRAAYLGIVTNDVQIKFDDIKLTYRIMKLEGFRESAVKLADVNDQKIDEIDKAWKELIKRK